MASFKPLHDRVLVRRVQGEEKTKGGLIIPDTAKEKPAEGEVVAVGEGARKDSGELIAPASRPATASCSASGRAPRSPSTVRNT
jgi:chaperonin GroES